MSDREETNGSESNGNGNGDGDWGHRGTRFIAKAAVRERLGDVNVSADFYDALDGEVAEMVEEASRRADANGRKTVQPRDL